MGETIGLLGGSFNPIHEGHLTMAQAAREELELARMILLPDGDPPHKGKELAGKRHRLRMAELAAAGRFEVSAMEVDRPGKTYTIDTLQALHTLYPGVRIVWIIGADTLHELPTWKDAARVFTLCEFAVFARDDLPLMDIPGATVRRMKTAIPDISATEIRARVHAGLSLAGYTPRAVEDYIGLHRLYDPPPLRDEAFIRARLQETLPPARYKHTLGVEETMRRLAARWGMDEEKAGLTGLLHDAAKAMTLEEMQAYVDAQGEPSDAGRRKSTALLHGIAGAAMARAEFGVTDPDILTAIRYHNTGHVPMKGLEKLLYLADMSEPGRKDLPWMADLRALSMKDLDAAVRETMRIKLDHITARGQYVHPDTAAAYAAIDQEIREREGTA